MDAFYEAFATQDVKSASSRMLSQEGMHAELSHAVGWGMKEMVSLQPTTLAIPESTCVLCRVCAEAFDSHHLQCDECHYVPRVEERWMKDCTHCFEGVISRN